MQSHEHYWKSPTEKGSEMGWQFSPEGRPPKQANPPPSGRHVKGTRALMAPLLTELSRNVWPSSVWLFLPSNLPTLHLFLTAPHWLPQRSHSPTCHATTCISKTWSQASVTGATNMSSSADHQRGHSEGHPPPTDCSCKRDFIDFKTNVFSRELMLCSPKVLQPVSSSL